MASVRISCAFCGQAFEVAEGQTEVRCPECGKTPGEAATAGALVSGTVGIVGGAQRAQQAQPVPPIPVVPPVVSSGNAPPPVFDRRNSAPQAAGASGAVGGGGVGVGGGAGVIRDGGAPGGSQVVGAATQVLTYGKEFSASWWGRAKKSLAKHARDIVPTSTEQDALAQNGVHDPAVQKHFVWRRNLLWLILVPTTFMAMVITIQQLAEGWEWATAFGVFMTLLYLASVWAIPVTALLAERSWYRPRRSRGLLLMGFAVSYAVIVLWGLLPIHWSIKLEESDPDVAAAGKEIVQAIGGALIVFFWLLPAILSLLPGAIRACVRIKVLFPESIVSGWLLITLTPVYALLLMTLFILVNQMSGNVLLVLGTALVVLAPAAYIGKTGLFIRPISSDEGGREVERTQWVYQIILAGGFALLILYALTGRILGMPIVKFGREDGLIGFGRFSWEAIKFAVDYLGRSLFITAIAMDWFLLINVSVWRNMREFEKTDAAAGYENTVEELGRVLGR